MPIARNNSLKYVHLIVYNRQGKGVIYDTDFIRNLS